MKNIKNYNDFINESSNVSEEDINKITPFNKLVKGAKLGSIPIVKKAIEEGARKERFAIYNAIVNANREGHLNIIKYLMERYKFNNMDYFAEDFVDAYFLKHIDICKYFLEKGLSIYYVINHVSKENAMNIIRTFIDYIDIKTLIEKSHIRFPKYFISEISNKSDELIEYNTDKWKKKI